MRHTSVAAQSLLKLRAWIIRWQIEHPYAVLLLVILLSVPSLLCTLKLDLKTDFAELLPQNKASVIELHRVHRHLPSATTLAIVAKGPRTAALERFVDELAPRLKALGPQYVTSIDAGMQQTRAFIERHKLLYAPYKELKEIHDEVAERYERSVGEASGLLVELDDEKGPAAQRQPFADLRRRINESVERATRNAPHPEGYYLSADKRTIVVQVKTPMELGNLEQHERMMQCVHRVLADLHLERIDPQIKVGFTGDFIVGAEEYKIIKDDLTNVGVWGILMIIGVVLLFFLHLRTVFALTITISVGLIWTFAFTRLTVGHLNTSTGFLVSIVAGNGINFGIIYLARYLEARSRERLPVPESIRLAHHDTWGATLAASAAAMCAYGSLAVTDFRGFKHFGIIGGAGMLLCWLATYLVIPAFISLTERYSSAADDEKSWRARARASYGLAFAAVVRRIPGVVVCLSLMAVAVGTVLTVHFLRSAPMEHNLRKIRNVPRTVSEAQQLAHEVDRIIGRFGQDGMAILVDRLDQVLPLKRILEARRDAAPREQKPFDQVVTIFDMLPSQQREKVTLVEGIARRLRRAHEHGVIAESDWAQINEYLPQHELKVLTIADLPAKLAEPFTEVDGTRGRIVYLAPRTGRSVWDARYLHTWADSFRETRLPTGAIIRGSGRAVIFSDMLRAVEQDAPKAIIVSLLGTAVVVLLTFGLRRKSLVVLSTVVIGSIWLLAFMALRGLRINFLNFVVFPITIGIGADYAINIMRRYQIEGSAAIERVLVETGGAVVLCSLTTIVGYSALMLSTNLAITSFGLTAVCGEIVCLVAALLLVPSVIVWHGRRRSGAARDRSTREE